MYYFRKKKGKNNMVQLDDINFVKDMKDLSKLAVGWVE